MFFSVCENRIKLGAALRKGDYKGTIKKKKSLWAKREREVCMCVWKMFKGRRETKPQS